MLLADLKFQSISGKYKKMYTNVEFFNLTFITIKIKIKTLSKIKLKSLWTMHKRIVKYIMLCYNCIQFIITSKLLHNINPYHSLMRAKTPMTNGTLHNTVAYHLIRYFVMLWCCTLTSNTVVAVTRWCCDTALYYAWMLQVWTRL